MDTCAEPAGQGGGTSRPAGDRRAAREGCWRPGRSPCLHSCVPSPRCGPGRGRSPHQGLSGRGKEGIVSAAKANRGGSPTVPPREMHLRCNHRHLRSLGCETGEHFPDKAQLEQMEMYQPGHRCPVSLHSLLHPKGAHTHPGYIKRSTSSKDLSKVNK